MKKFFTLGSSTRHQKQQQKIKEQGYQKQEGSVAPEDQDTLSTSSNQSGQSCGQVSGLATGGHQQPVSSHSNCGQDNLRNQSAKDQRRRSLLAPTGCPLQLNIVSASIVHSGPTPKAEMFIVRALEKILSDRDIKRSYNSQLRKSCEESLRE